jgi:biopolymer transport protein ExbB
MTWIALEAGSQGQDAKLAGLMQEEAGKGGGEDLTIHLMKVISRSVTLDGWLVIGLCTFMLLLAVIVFILKFLLLNKIQRDNRDFLEAFKDNHDPLGMTESEEGAFEHSSLYRVYMAGHDEIVKWLSRHAKEGDELVIERLTPSVINIYRSALDRASVREGQRLSAWMIVLTLGISGGPFWGLLGTVWGVMNTFAALAEAGEANLSAIAPGVASALACTLFGLFVAIPTLFGYSYLNVRMKMVSADNRTFIDELLVKIEDVYGATT